MNEIRENIKKLVEEEKTRTRYCNIRLDEGPYKKYIAVRLDMKYNKVRNVNWVEVETLIPVHRNKDKAAVEALFILHKIIDSIKNTKFINITLNTLEITVETTAQCYEIYVKVYNSVTSHTKEFIHDKILIRCPDETQLIPIKISKKYINIENKNFEYIPK